MGEDASAPIRTSTSEHQRHSAPRQGGVSLRAQERRDWGQSRPERPGRSRSLVGRNGPTAPTTWPARLPDGPSATPDREPRAGGRSLSLRPTRSPVVQQDVWLPDLAVREAHSLHARVLRHIPLQVVVCPGLRDTRTGQRPFPPAHRSSATLTADQSPRRLRTRSSRPPTRCKATGNLTIPLRTNADSIKTAFNPAVTAAALRGGAEATSGPGCGRPPWRVGFHPHPMGECFAFKIFHEDPLEK